VQPGDILTTSGIDGVFPPGLPVARVEKVERRVELPFALIYCVPQARVAGASQVLVLPTLAGQQPPRPQEKPVIAGKPVKKDSGKGVQK
jgi:rod shape-determining protein MreC